MTIFIVPGSKMRKQPQHAEGGKVWSPCKVRRSLLDPCRRMRKEALSQSIPFISSWTFGLFKILPGWWCITQQKHYGSPWPSARCPGTLPPPAPTQLSIRPTWGCLAAVVMASPCWEKCLGSCVWKPSVWCRRLSSSNTFWTATQKLFPSSIWGICSCNQVVTRLSFSVTSLISGSTRCRRTPIFSLQLTGLHHGGPLFSSLLFFSSLSSFSCCFPLLLLFLFDWIKPGMPTRAFRLASLRASSFKMHSPKKTHPTQKSSWRNSSLAGSLS